MGILIVSLIFLGLPIIAITACILDKTNKVN